MIILVSIISYNITSPGAMDFPMVLGSTGRDFPLGEANGRPQIPYPQKSPQTALRHKLRSGGAWGTIICLK